MLLLLVLNVRGPKQVSSSSSSLAAEAQDYRAAKRNIKLAQKGLKIPGLKETPPELIPVADLSAEIDAIARLPEDKRIIPFKNFNKKMAALGKEVRSAQIKFLSDVPAQKTPVSKEQKKSTVQSAGQGPKQTAQSAKDKAEKKARRSRLLDTNRQSADSEVGRTGAAKPKRKTAMPGESGVAFPKATKPKARPKTVDTKSKPKTVTAKPKPRPERTTVTAKPKPRPERTLAERPTTSASTRKMMEKRKAADRRSEKDKGSRNARTETRKPGRFSEEAAKKFFKEKFGIDVTYDKGDDLDPLVARGEEPGRKKGGLFTRRGALYNKPARKNSKG
jgi:hypothetical protein